MFKFRQKRASGFIVITKNMILVIDSKNVRCDGTLGHRMDRIFSCRKSCLLEPETQGNSRYKVICHCNLLIKGFI